MYWFEEYKFDDKIYKNIIAEIGEDECNGIYVIQILMHTMV